MAAIILVAISGLGGLIGLISVILATVQHELAERALVRTMRNQKETLQRLEALRRGLEVNSPDAEKVTEASRIVGAAAEVLSNRYRSDILATLNQGSGRSKASYIAKLVDEIGGEA
jgi:hypothetical protein